jgi:hypothetical protein
MPGLKHNLRQLLCPQSNTDWGFFLLFLLTRGQRPNGTKLNYKKMRYSIFALFALVYVVGCGKKESEKNLHITGNIDGLKKGTVYIQKISDSSLVAIDTIIIDGDSQFTADLDIKSPEMYYLFLDRGVTNSLDNNLAFFAEPGQINISTSLEHFHSDAKITGSKNHEKYVEFKKVTSRYNDSNLTWAGQKINAYKIGNQKLIDSIEKLQDLIIKRRYLYTTNFALTNKNMEVAPYVALSEIADINIIYLDTIRKSMTPDVAKSMYGKKLADFVKVRKEQQ